MSSYKNAQKSNQKVHRERSQLSSRAHLGHLEKKKDYKKRAEDYQRKQKTLKVLKQKAQDRNPDEFYFKMIRTQLKDGVHQSEDSTPDYTVDQLKLIHGQDLKYVNYRRSMEHKKIERLKESLHLLEVEKKSLNKHTVFFDSKKEVEKFDAAAHFDTHPALVDRAYNRPRKETLKSEQFTTGALDDSTMEKVALDRSRRCRELAKRIHREKELKVVAQKMEVKQQLLDKTTQKRKVTEETKHAPAVYKYKYKRKR